MVCGNPLLTAAIMNEIEVIREDVISKNKEENLMDVKEIGYENFYRGLRRIIMSKENALRFMIVKDKDKTIKKDMNAIMGRYERKNLSEDEWDGVLKEEIIPLAKKYGYDFTPEDLKELQNLTEGELSDEELDEVAGGQGQITLTFRNRYHSIMTYKATCDYMPDDQTFRMRYDQYPTDCPNYVWFGNGNNVPTCKGCANCRLGM